MADPADPLCGAASTNMKEIFGSYRCTTQSNYYTVNPEGIMQYFAFDFYMQHAGGSSLGGASYSTGSMYDGATSNVGVTTKIKDQNGDVVSTSKPGSYIKLKVEDMLQYANVDLQEFAPKDSQGSGALPLPYNRMTGATIQVGSRVRDIRSLTLS